MVNLDVSNVQKEQDSMMMHHVHAHKEPLLSRQLVTLSVRLALTIVSHASIFLKNALLVLLALFFKIINVFVVKVHIYPVQGLNVYLVCKIVISVK